MIALGEMRDRVTLLRPSPTNDGQGGRTIAWVDLITGSATATTTLAAAVRARTVDESMRATGAIGSIVTWLVTIRYRADVLPTMRAQWRPYAATASVTAEIRGVRPHEDRLYLDLECAVLN